MIRYKVEVIWTKEGFYETYYAPTPENATAMAAKLRDETGQPVRVVSVTQAASQDN